MIAIRHKIVTHADSRYFPVRLVKNFLPDVPGRLHDFAIRSGQTLPRLNLLRMRANASHLAAVFALHAHEAAQEVRKTRKRLHSK